MHRVDSRDKKSVGQPEIHGGWKGKQHRERRAGRGTWTSGLDKGGKGGAHNMWEELQELLESTAVKWRFLESKAVGWRLP
jgi:hypothetical protein